MRNLFAALIVALLATPVYAEVNINDYTRGNNWGSVAGASPVSKFGTNPDIDTGGWEDIWDGGADYPYQTTAQSLEIVSDDVDDDGGVNEIQQFDLGSATDGNFTITVDGVGTTASIPYDASNATVLSALETLGTPVGAVTLGGGALPGTPVTLTFGGVWGYQDIVEIVVNNVDLVGETITVSTLTPGVAPGTGAIAVRIYGLDSSYVEQDETVRLDGTTAIDLANDYLRVYRVKVLTAGSSETNEGTLTLQLDGFGAVQAKVLPDYGQSQMAIYTIPSGKQGHLFTVMSTMAGRTNATSSVQLLTREFGGAWQVKYTVAVSSSGSSSYLVSESFPLVLPEKTDIRMRADSDTNNAALSGEFDLLLRE